jgi:hypothetical protein
MILSRERSSIGDDDGCCGNEDATAGIREKKGPASVSGRSRGSRKKRHNVEGTRLPRLASPRLALPLENLKGAAALTRFSF